jgi:hypothetical protein
VGAAVTLPARDLLDVRLSEAIRTALGSGGCPICGVRARSERAVIDSVIAERVNDRGFRGELERTGTFCRRHTRELIVADRAETGGILGSSILYRAMLRSRLEVLRPGVGTKGRTLRTRLSVARKRPPCFACTQGASAVSAAIARSVERAADPDWVEALSEVAFCLDDLVLLWTAASSSDAFDPIARRQLDRLTDLDQRLDGFAHNSSQDRRHLMTDRQRAAADEASRLLGGERD